MRKPSNDQEPSERMGRGELTPKNAYERSSNPIQDDLISKPYRQLRDDAPKRGDAGDFSMDSSATDTPSSEQQSDERVRDGEREADQQTERDRVSRSATAEDELSTHNPEAVYRLVEIIADIKTAMLTTIDADGTLRSRPMLTQDYQQDQTLWFFSSDHYGKAEELARDPRVNLTYSMPEKRRFISISGTAEIVHDEYKKRELWKPSFQEWFPEGSNDTHLALLKVTIQKAEYWDVPSNSLIEILSFTKAVLTGGTYHTAEPHQRIVFEHPRSNV